MIPGTFILPISFGKYNLKMDIKEFTSALKKLNPEFKVAKVKNVRDYIEILVHAQNPLYARRMIASQDFQDIYGHDIIPLRKTKENGFRLQIQDEEKPTFIRIRKGGIWNAGVANEVSFLDKIKGMIESGKKNFAFFDSTGYKIHIRNVTGVRDCSKDYGSRMGNRADIEFETSGGPYRISLKKDNGQKIAGLVRRLAPMAFKYGKIVRSTLGQLDNGYISVRITNEELYKFCWFGNDIKPGHGAVIRATANVDSSQAVTQIIDPKNFSRSMMMKDATSAWLLIRTHKSGKCEFLSAYTSSMAKRYEIKGLVLPGING